MNLSLSHIIHIHTGVGQGLEKEALLEARIAATKEGGPIYSKLSQIEKFVADNGKAGHAVGDKLSIADIMIYAQSSHVTCGFFDGVSGEALTPFPNIQKVRKLVASHAAVVKYYEGKGDDITPFEKYFRDAKDL